MDFHRGYERHRAKTMGLASGEHYLIRGIHLAMFCSVFVSPALGPLLVALVVLIYAGERLPHTEREAIFGLNFAITVAGLQLCIMVVRRVIEGFGGNPLFAMAPSLAVSILTLYFTWRAFKRTGTETLPRYKYSFRPIRPNRQWHENPEHLHANFFERYGLKRKAKMVDLRKGSAQFDEQKK